MTLSVEDRWRDIAFALKLMIDAVGDGIYGSVDFRPDQLPFSQILPTTWRELEDRELVERHGIRYLLTASGWFVCIQALGKLEDPEFQKLMGKLTAELKKHVKGRHEDALVQTRMLASDAGIPVAFVYNAIESRLLDHAFNIKGAYWSERARRGLWIVVPLDFGQRPLD